MKAKHLQYMLVIGLALVPTTAMAQKEKRPDVSGFPFWKAPKVGHSKPFVPGLNAVLMLSDEQKEKVVAAQRETIDSETVREAGRKVKTNPNAGEAERQAAREVMERVQTDLDVRVAVILTAEQKALIENINAAYDEVRNAVGQEFQPRYAAAKGNEQEAANVRKEALEKTEADFVRRLSGMLSSEQNLALAKAAAEEKERAAKASAQKKP